MTDEEGKMKWHKVADGDYPPCERDNYSFNVLTDCGDIAYYNYDEECWVAEPSSAEIDPPVAWCEIPKYEEQIMFEKEAEDSFNGKKVLYKWETDKRSYIDGFKDGAKFGYNKCDKIIRKENAELKEQIEKMKNCQNCRWWDWNTCKHKDGFCKNRLNWESKRNT